MNNDSLKAFGEAMLTLEPGDTDQHGNEYSDIAAYNVEINKQADSASVNLTKFDSDCPF